MSNMSDALFSLSFYICSEIPHTGGTRSVSVATKIFLICRSLLPLIMAQVHNLESKLDLVHMQQGGRNPCSSSAERAGATAVAFLLPPPPPPFPPPPRVPRAASPLPVRLSRAAITSGATWLRSGNIQIHRFKSLLWLFADWLFLKCQLQSSDGYLFTFKAEILQTGLFEFGPSGSKWL